MVFLTISATQYGAQVVLDAQESQKIYVDPTDVLVTCDGLFLKTPTEFVQLSHIGHDEYGIYIELRPCEIRPSDGIPKCSNGHDIWHIECNGCANWWCIYRCKCYSPW